MVALNSSFPFARRLAELRRTSVVRSAESLATFGDRGPQVLFYLQLGAHACDFVDTLQPVPLAAGSRETRVPVQL